MNEKLGRIFGESAKLFTYVKNDPNHDLRYAIDALKLNKKLDGIYRYPLIKV